jgi:hypothetical protein
MCQLAEVPRVTPHGLRGTQSAIATAEGGSAQLVAAGLGHANPTITAAAYIDKEVASDAQARRAWKVLAWRSDVIAAGKKLRKVVPHVGVQCASSVRLVTGTPANPIR